MKKGSLVVVKLSKLKPLMIYKIMRINMDDKKCIIRDINNLSSPWPNECIVETNTLRLAEPEEMI